ncbi:MAG: PASTA domain-containing protein [Flavobacteriaceae bacterium]|jgi:beta-lactam-binding protein with PASTA domain|nr:PASTA domain-containing protein [Flavobacteriaceae bacterium]
MKLMNFFKTKEFIVSLIAAVIISIAGVFLAMKWLKITTNHGQKIEVPSLVKLDTNQATSLLESKELELIILDTLDFDKNFPPLAIVEQDPVAGTAVKENRKIYVKINASGFGYIKLPKFEEMTYRQALATLKSLGLREGVITYRTFIGKDVVLEAYNDGQKVKAGSQIKKNSRIDFVLGDGKAGLSVEQLDEAPEIDMPKDETPVENEFDF